MPDAKNNAVVAHLTAKAGQVSDVQADAAKTAVIHPHRSADDHDFAAADLAEASPAKSVKSGQPANRECRHRPNSKCELTFFVLP